MNRNSRAKFNRSHDAFARVKRGRPQSDDVALSQNVGHKPRHSKHPKVAWQHGAVLFTKD